MSRLVLVLLIVSLATVTMAKPNSNVRKPDKLAFSCGKPLLQRVLSVCGGPCFGDGELSLVQLGCLTGITDDQLVVLCCPQQ